MTCHTNVSKSAKSMDTQLIGWSAISNKAYAVCL